MNVKEDMLKKKKEINEKTEIFIFVFLAFILLTTWAMTQPFNSGPDEQMRYYVADYIYKHHGALPGGDDPAVRNKVWGISYAYYPVVSYMVSALFMRISRLFADPGYSMFKIARMADVLFVTGAVYFVVKASGKLFPKEKYSREVRWLFAALAGFMPQAIFVGTLCEYRLTGTAGSSHDSVCMGLLSERRLDMEKLYTPCSGNGRMCIVLL